MSYPKSNGKKETLAWIQSRTSELVAEANAKALKSLGEAKTKNLVDGSMPLLLTVLTRNIKGAIMAAGTLAFTSEDLKALASPAARKEKAEALQRAAQAVAEAELALFRARSGKGKMEKAQKLEKAHAQFDEAALKAALPYLLEHTASDARKMSNELTVGKVNLAGVVGAIRSGFKEPLEADPKKDFLDMGKIYDQIIALELPVSAAQLIELMRPLGNSQRDEVMLRAQDARPELDAVFNEAFVQFYAEDVASQSAATIRRTAKAAQTVVLSAAKTGASVVKGGVALARRILKK